MTLAILAQGPTGGPFLLDKDGHDPYHARPTVSRSDPKGLRLKEAFLLRCTLVAIGLSDCRVALAVATGGKADIVRLGRLGRF